MLRLWSARRRSCLDDEETTRPGAVTAAERYSRSTVNATAGGVCSVALHAVDALIILAMDRD